MSFHQQLGHTQGGVVTAAWIVVDTHTGLQVGGTYKTGRRARAACDRLDNAYGAVRYTARRVKVL